MRRETLQSLLAVTLAVAGGLAGCAPPAAVDAEGPRLTPEQQAELDDAVGQADGKADGFGLAFFRSSYINLVLAGKSKGGDVALVAGSHSRDFPYWRTKPWDNGLLWVAGKGYTFTQRTRGVALSLDVRTDRSAYRGAIRYRGTMVRAEDNVQVPVSLSVPVNLIRFEARQEGKKYNFLDLDEIPGMRWQPFSITSAAGTLTVGDESVEVADIRGELEYGVMANLKAPEFGIAYDYVALARGGQDGYCFVDFVSHPLYRECVLADVLDWYMTTYASESVTLARYSQEEGNLRGVDRPRQSDGSVVLFETSVDLGLANLRRQMISSSDADGATVYGLREIFEAK